MSYVKHTWVNNEAITASKMNNIEEGIEEASQSGGGGGYDAEIIIYHDNNSSHNYEFTIVSGSYASLRSLFSNHITPTVLVRVYDELSNIRSSTTNVWFYSAGADEGSIVLFIKALKNNTSNYTNDWWSMSYLNWTPQDELYWN